MKPMHKLPVVKIGSQRRWKRFLVQFMRYPQEYLIEFENGESRVMMPPKQYLEYQRLETKFKLQDAVERLLP